MRGAITAESTTSPTLRPPYVEATPKDNRVGQLNAALSNRYRIERKVGRGGMATVYLADDLRHHRPVAVKVLHGELAASLAAERFLREIEIIARLQHPHILTLIDSGEVDGFLYYVMPFVDGPSLRARLNRERELPIADSIRILCEVADALAEAHAHGVIHRDVKPDNVLLHGVHAVVTDFGVAKAVRDAADPQGTTTTGVTLGTPAYMAPEQAAADPVIDHRADIYALGVMAYEMLTGRTPFSGATAPAVLSAQLTQTPAPVSSHRATIPARLADVVMRCLEKAPADRWQTAGEIVRQLESVTTPAIAEEAPAAVHRAGRRRAFSRRWMAGAAGATVMGALSYMLLSDGLAGRSPNEWVPTLAALPFENRGTPEEDYFVDGMTDELIGRLARVSGLRVINRASAIQYKKTDKELPQIASELGADFVIEGSVRWEKRAARTGPVRISAQVVRVSDRTVVWAEQFDKPYGAGIFEIQSDIAERIADAVDVTLLKSEHDAVSKVPTTNLAAYDAYLLGREYLHRAVSQNWEAERRAAESFETAVRMAPEFALAHAWLARTYSSMRASGYDLSLASGVTSGQRLEMIRAAAERALAIDNELPEAHGALANYFYWTGDTARLAEERRLALVGNPSDAQGYVDRGGMLITEGKVDEGLRDLRRAVALDPRNPVRHMRLGVFYWNRRDYRAAEESYDWAIAVAAHQPEPYVAKAWLVLTQGRVEDARTVMREGARRVGLTTLLFKISQGDHHTITILDGKYADAARHLTRDVFGADSLDYYKLKAAVHTDPATKRAYSDSLAAWAAARLKRSDSARDSDPAYALNWIDGTFGAGRRVAAARELQRVRSDPRYGWAPNRRARLARICVTMGEYDCAIEHIRVALNYPLVLTPALLRIDPIWKPLSGRADFRKLAELPP